MLHLSFAREAVDASTQRLDFLHVQETRSIDIRDVKRLLDQTRPREGTVQVEGRAELDEVELAEPSASKSLNVLTCVHLKINHMSNSNNRKRRDPPPANPLVDSHTDGSSVTSHAIDSVCSKICTSTAQTNRRVIARNDLYRVPIDFHQICTSSSISFRDI